MRNRINPILHGLTLGLAAGLCLVGLAGPAAAKGAPQITLYGGMYFGGSIYTGTSTVAADRQINIGSSFDWGLQGAYLFNNSIGLEFTYGHNSGDIMVDEVNISSIPEETVGTLGENRYEFNLNFYTNPGKTVGYFTLGAGWTDYKAEIDGAYTDTGTGASGTESDFVTNIGLGALMYVKPNLALRLDGRWRYTDTEIGSDYTYCDIYGYCYTYDDSYYGSGTLTLGLTYMVGKK